MIETTGDRIKKLRIAKGLSQAGLGNHAGVSRAAVSQWESGNTKELRPTNLLEIAKALGTTVEYLVLGKDDAEPRGLLDMVANPQKHQVAVPDYESGNLLTLAAQLHDLIKTATADKKALAMELLVKYIENPKDDVIRRAILALLEKDSASDSRA